MHCFQTRNGLWAVASHDPVKNVLNFSCKMLILDSAYLVAFFSVLLWRLLKRFLFFAKGVDAYESGTAANRYPPAGHSAGLLEGNRR